MIFPDCNFKVLLPHGSLFAGRRAEGVLELDVPEDIPRADHVSLVYTASGWAGYGSGKNRSVVRRDIFVAPLNVDIPTHVLPKGVHRYPFALDIPPWIPPYYAGSDCGIEHRLDVRVDVDWAIDPKLTLSPIVVLSPYDGTHTPATVRTPPHFHESIVLEIALASSTISVEEPLQGHVALRSGHGARFDAIVLELCDVATVRMGRGDRRTCPRTVVRLPADAMRGGEAIPFVFPPSRAVSGTFRNAHLENDVVLKVSVDIPWASDPELVIPLTVLPAGSRMFGSAGVAAVGGARLRLSAATMAQATGLAEGAPPVLVEGSVGPVRLRVFDAPREGRIGADVEMSFPDVELGITFRPLGMLEGFRESPLLAKPLSDKYLLRVKRDEHAPPVPDAALAAFFAALTAGFESADEIRMSDHHVAAHLSLVDDDTGRMVALAQFLHGRAKAIGDALRALPFPAEHAVHLPAWAAAAQEQGATLVPSGPSMAGLSFGTQLADGGERSIGATLRTRWGAGGPSTLVEIDLRGATVSAEAARALESGTAGAAGAVRAHFPTAHVEGTSATLARPGFTPDPRALLPGLEAFFEWLLDARGERRATTPYR